MNKYNTIALVYLDKDINVIAWSADTFGSPRSYPKTYRDTKENREMLARKWKNIEKDLKKEYEEFKSFDKVNPLGGHLVNKGLKSNRSFLLEKKVKYGLITRLSITTDYEKDLPKWDTVKECIDSKNFIIEA